MSDYKAEAEALDIALYGKPDIYAPPEEFMPRRAAIAEKLAELFPDRAAVDYKAETERLIKFAEGNGSESAATAAVATATLYAGEQQRIANLIALADGFDLGNLPVAAADALINSHNDSFGRVADGIRDEIREGLGLS